ncbi:phage GP46 family protein [Variovorax sp. RCC_210]|uniref:phage GP46 family protein n=1 Tax=Variovorax sp. RCC_210 TaxID=3239217 RepID=UPI0035267C99
MSNLNKTVTPIGPGRYNYSKSDITGFSRASTATYFDDSGALRIASVNEPRFEGGQLVVEEQGTNLLPWSACTDMAGKGTTPPTCVATTVDGFPCSAITFDQTMTQGFAGCRADRSTPGMTAPVTLGARYSTRGYIKLSRPLVGSEQIQFLFTGASGLGTFPITAANSADFLAGFRPAIPPAVLALGTGVNYPVVTLASAVFSPLVVYCCNAQIEQAASISSYIPTAGAAVTRAADFASLIQYLAGAPGSLTMSIDGNVISVTGALRDPLTRAVIISLFTWARARADDQLPGDERMGWWGDTYPAAAGDRTGSRLWLLSRSTITATTAQRAREYAQEALAWLVADGVATEVIVQAEREGLSQISLWCQIVRGDGSRIDIRFNDAWSFLNGI